MFKENAIRILSAAGVEFRQLHFPHNERLLVLRSLVFTDCWRLAIVTGDNRP
jgi:hypothetical protein